MLYPADVLVASPPCLVFSKANRTSTAEGQLATARKQVSSLCRVIRLLAPKAIIMEQTEGLRSYCCLAYGEYLSMWDGLGYRVYHSSVDARTTSMKAGMAASPLMCPSASPQHRRRGIFQLRRQ